MKIENRKSNKYVYQCYIWCQNSPHIPQMLEEKIFPHECSALEFVQTLIYKPIHETNKKDARK